MARMNALRAHPEVARRNGGVEATMPTGHADGEIAVIDRIRRAGLSGPEASSPVVSVAIADGQELVRAGVRVLLERHEQIAVVGEAADGEEAVALVRRIHPNVVLLDVDLPGLDCVEVTRRMLAHSGVAVMLLTATDGDERIMAALRAGASGQVPRDTDPTALVRAVGLLAQGEALLSPPVARRLIAELASRPEPSAPSSKLVEELTAREREVVALVALGLTNDEIAERLVVSRATAKTHVSRAMVKIHAHDRAKLVVFAYEAGLVVPRTDPPAHAAAPPLAA
jgi:DNA-binding NarL/FixJ family response regulator